MTKTKVIHVERQKAEAKLLREQEQRRTWGRLNAQSKANQNLGFSIARLNHTEIAFFFKKATTILQNPKIKAKKKAAILILLVSFWTGRAVEDVVLFKIIRRLQTSPAHEGIYLLGGELFWILHVPGPDVLGVRLTDQSPACKVKRYIQLKIPYTFKDLIMPHVKSMMTNENHNNLFDVDLLHNQTLFSNVLSSIKDERNKRLNLTRIADFLFWELAHHPSSDFATALLVVGAKSSHKISQPYYTTLGENWLQAIYGNVCDVLEAKLELKVEPSLIREYTRVKTLPEPDVYLGSPFRPKRSAVKSLIRDLQGEIQGFLDKKNWSLEDIMRFQKPYVLYNWLMYGFSSGARPIVRPRLYPNRINLANGLAVISDKDKDGRENTRKVWLWDEMCDQIKKYNEHIEVLYDRIGCNVPSLIELFKRHGSRNAAGHLFFINNNYKLEFITPGWIEEVLKNNYNYDMPARSHRHYIRSNLLERKCPVETIDAFMGHAKLGQEPWTQYSAFYQADLVDSLKKHLMPQLQEDGWRALPGLTKEKRR